MSKEVNQEECAPRTVEDVKEMLVKHSNGEIQRTIQNCITILQNDHVLADAIRLNLLSERIDIVKPVGWPRSSKTLNDTDMKYILRRMEKYGRRAGSRSRRKHGIPFCNCRTACRQSKHSGSHLSHLPPKNQKPEVMFIEQRSQSRRMCSPNR